MANSELNLALKIKADLNEALSKFKQLEKELQANAKAGADLGNHAKAGAAGLGDLGKRADEATAKLGKTRAGVESISRQLADLKKQAIGLTLGQFAIGNLVATSDNFRNLEARVKLVSRTNTEAKGTFSGLMAVAQETGTAFAGVAELYTRVFRSLGDTANSAEVLRFTKTVSQAMTVSGASAQEAQAVIIQLSQGMAAGALRGEEFNSVSEQAPIILELLQKSLGKTRGELRKLAEEGQLTTQVIMTAIAEGADSIQKQYEQMPLTIGKAVTQLSNAWLEFVGGFGGTASGVATAISLLADNFNLLANVGVAAALVYLSRFVAGLSAVDKAQKAWIATAALVTTATNLETAAVGKQTVAYNLLAVAKSAAARAGAGLMALVGGPVGLAVTAIVGLASAYVYLKNQEEEAERQFTQTLTTLDANIDKTQALVEARTKLSEIGGFSDRLEQLKVNTESLKEAQAELDKLIAKRDELVESAQNDVWGSGFFDDSALAKVNQQIDELQPKVDAMTAASEDLANVTQTQLALAWDGAIEAGGELAEKLTELGDPQHPEAVKLLTEAIKNNETEALAMNNEVTNLVAKLQKDLSTASSTAVEQLEAMRAKFQGVAAQAGLSGGAVQGFINKINEAIGLQQQLAQAKSSKEGASELDRLRTQARQSGMSALERNLDNVKNNSNWSDEQKKEAEALYRTIDANQKRLRAQAQADRKTASAANKAQREAESKAKKAASEAKRTAEEAHSKVQSLNSDYLRLIGQGAKADLLDVQSKYNQLMQLFQKANNQEGISLVKKMLPLEEAKLQLNAIEAEIDKIMQSQSNKEQSIQTQVQTGLLTHFEGQARLRDVYAQTTQELEKQVKLLEEMAKQPGAQGEAASAAMAKLKAQMEATKSTAKNLEDAFIHGVGAGIEDSLMGLVRGTMTLSEAIKNFAQTVVNSMAQMAAQELAMQAMSGLKGFFAGAAGSAAGSAAGGAVTAATGGYISGPGTGTSDSIPARLSNGEFVVRAASVQKYGTGFLHAINQGRLRKYATGGLVSAPVMPTPSNPSLTSAMQDGVAGQVQAVASPVHIQQTLAVDSAELFTAGINTVAGERAVMTVIRANKQTLKQELT